MGKALYKTRKKQLKERTGGTRDPRPNSFLIISEGEQTEPHYFDGLADYINQRYGKSIDVQKPLIKPHGEGKSTVSLVNEALKIAARSKVMYSQTWILFDKDDFDDFDDAVSLCKNLNYNAGWSNQSFEYWLYLHFAFSDSALHRNEWNNKLNQFFKDKLKIKSGYSKNDPALFTHVTSDGGLRRALQNAEKADKNYPEGTPPSKCDPCTKVYLLLRELEPWLQDLI